MKHNVKLLAWITIFILALLLAACGGSDEANAPDEEVETTEEVDTTEVEEVEETAPEDISGDLIILTHRTDLVDTVLVDYVAQFNEIYPEVNIEFEAITDYEGETRIRMNTEEYGDVLHIPNSITADELSDFFTPLGSVDELDSIYNFVTEKAFEGQVYGIPITGNAQGVVYNKAVFEAAGITELPTTPEAFLEAMHMIQDNTDALPYYTNYAAGWPLVQWESHRGSVSCEANYSNDMVFMDAPFAEGTAHYTIYKLMHDLVAEGLTEEDPTTTDWESSKPAIGNGEIGAMMLGSWAIVQMQDAAENPDDIGYMPFPSNIDGTVCAAAGGDYSIAINKHSQNQAAARAWIDWFLNESNFAYDQGGIPPLKGSDLPPQLQAFQELDVQFVQSNPAPAGQEGWLDNIDAEAEVGLWEPTFKQRIVDAAREASGETLDEIFADLNGRWAAAQAEIVGGAEPVPVEEVVEEPAAEEMMVNEDIAGSITVLTNRTDIVDTVFVDYAAQFNEIYPNVEIEFEAITDYEGEVTIRMNTEEYGDVLLIPNSISADELPDFFTPLGTLEELEPVYTFISEQAFDGQVYGINVTGNAQGVVYNKAVFEAAGISDLPTTPEAFLEAMHMIQDNTDALPYYTNYAAGWPLNQWESHRGSVTCNPNYSNEMVYMEAPFAEGAAHHTIYKLMYDLVAEGLTEEDPTTTDWESSKPAIGNGEVGAMVLGSWAIVQMQEAADNPDDIGYMPFPASVDGTVCAAAGGDYKIAINKHSENQEAARAWVDWFLNESNFAYDQGGIPPVIGSDLPPQLQAFADLNVVYVQANPAPAGEEGWLDNIDNEAEVGLWDPTFKQRIVDAARGATDETWDDIAADLNGRWAEAQAEIVGQ